MRNSSDFLLWYVTDVAMHGWGRGDGFAYGYGTVSGTGDGWGYGSYGRAMGAGSSYFYINQYGAQGSIRNYATFDRKITYSTGAGYGYYNSPTRFARIF